MVILIQIVSECAYYRGCKDCYFNRESRCAVYDKDIQWVLTIEEKKLLESVYSKESEEFYE